MKLKDASFLIIIYLKTIKDRENPSTYYLKLQKQKKKWMKNKTFMQHI
jgi:hypothetical protein